MIKEETNNKLKEIKQSFRLLMNGVTAQSMRETGVDYHLNWGASLGHLQEMAREYGKDYDLAIELWKENIRECKIMALLIMPTERMSPELADLWMEQTPSQEIAEQAAFYLYQHLSFAPVIAYRWIATDKPLWQICGFNILSRLFSQGQEPDERGISEFLDQASAAMCGDHLGVRHAAFSCLNRFATLGDFEEKLTESIIKKLGISFDFS